MTNSTAKSKTTEAANGPKATGREKKSHLIVPDINLGGLDDDDDEDDFRPARGFVPAKAAPAPTPSVPSQQDETDARRDVATESAEPVASVAAAATEATGQSTSSHNTSAAPTHTSAARTPSPRSDGAGDEQANTAAIQQSRGAEKEPSPADSQDGVRTRSSELTTWAGPGTAPAVRGSASLSGLPARRPGRRRTTEPFNADQPRQRGQEAMLELSQQAPNYASLLTVYSASQLNALAFENRNINLYGLVADQVGTQITADKALIKTLTLQRPKLTIAHYVDAALEPVLRPLDPTGIDMDAMEEERDYVWQLAQKGLAYRRYILSDPDSANLANYRPVCSLRADVNARLTRMMDLMESIQGLQAKPFEIVSACLAEYVGSLPGERPLLTAFFQKHLVTTIQ
ncbi:hypothetical protein [Streptomyces graminilatus]|uniref:hypothetical protein n=1 Tax=Streptomyces graminilatus TaxID=1464070 RepID=UPI000B1A290A|nr:hypothetical protein [Streptomyces graminilatus]